MPQSFKDLGVTGKPLPVRTRMIGRAWPLRAPVRDGLVPSWQELAAANGPSVLCMVSTSTVTFEPLCSLVICQIDVKLLERLLFFSIYQQCAQFFGTDSMKSFVAASILFIYKFSH